jgi:hypothetical protein
VVALPPKVAVALCPFVVLTVSVACLLPPLTGAKLTVIKVDAKRLKKIYDTNLATAHSEGQWARIQDSKTSFPYLQYDGCNSQENRKDHCAWNGMVLPVDDPWWRNHMPVKKWGCKCDVHQLTAGEVKRGGLKVSESPEEKYTTWKNERTGKTMRVPVGVDPAFNYPHGGAWLQNLQKLADERRDGLPEVVSDALNPVPRTAKESFAVIYGVRWYSNVLAAAKRDAAKNGLMDYNLTDDELVALRGWSGDGVAINRAMRENNPLYVPYVESINSALDKLPNWQGTALAGKEKLPFSGELVAGKVFKLSRFMATTRGKPYAGKYQFTIQSRTGKVIDGLSAIPEEMEVLFKSGTSFKVINFTESNGVTYVNIEEQS